MFHSSPGQSEDKRPGSMASILKIVEDQKNWSVLVVAKGVPRIGPSGHSRTGYVLKVAVAHRHWAQSPISAVAMNLPADERTQGPRWASVVAAEGHDGVSQDCHWPKCPNQDIARSGVQGSCRSNSWQ